MTYNAADEVQVKAAKKKQGILAVKKERVLRSVMGTEDGRAWMFELLTLCHVYQTSFHTNALTMAFQEGERQVGLRITADLVAIVPDLYFQMTRERMEDGDGTDDTDDSA